MSSTIIDAQQKDRPLSLVGTGTPNGINLDLSDVSLTGGNVFEGGGFFIDRGFFVVLTNVNIFNNQGLTKGGGIYSNNTAQLILNNVFVHDNYASNIGLLPGIGGGIYFSTGDGDSGYFPESFVLNINDSQIYNNVAYDGGGIYNTATLNIMRSTIEANEATGEGGGIFNVYSASVGQSKVLDNTADVNGGGIKNGIGGGSSDPGIGIYESEISGNTAEYGAGIYNQLGLSLTASTVSNNTASHLGVAY